jgi:hypothetical protein
MSDTPTASIGFAEDHDVEAFRRRLPFKVEPTNIPGIYSVPAPPMDFDLLTASKHELIKHGILIRKPTGEDHPALRASWDRFCTDHWPRMVRVNPTLELRDRVSRHSRPRPKQESAGLDSDGTSWSGAFNTGGKWQGILASWQVPAVSVPASQTVGQPNICPGDIPGQLPSIFPTGPWQSASWIGIGGFVVKGGNAIPGSDIIQVGILQEINVAGEATYQAFFEWYTSASSMAVTVPNALGSGGFSVLPGDSISASVFNDPQNNLPPQVSLYNARTGQTFSYMLGNAPAGSNDQAVSCEWVMEATNQSLTGSFGFPIIDDSTFPYFTPVIFHCTLACNSDYSAVEPWNLMQPLEIYTQTPDSCLDNGQLTLVTVTPVVAGAIFTVEIDCLKQ